MLTCGFDEPQLCIHKPKFLALYLCTKLKIMKIIRLFCLYVLLFSIRLQHGNKTNFHPHMHIQVCFFKQILYWQLSVADAT